jgi:general secretion pathway protein I
MRRSSQRGFTLLELLVATAIMAMAVAGALSALSTSMRNASRVTDYDRAAMLGRRKLDELLIDQKLPKRIPLEGRWDPAYTNGRAAGWRAQVRPFEWPPGTPPGAAILEQVQLEIWWEDANGQRRTYGLEGFRRGIMTPADVAAGAVGAQP